MNKSTRPKVEVIPPRLYKYRCWTDERGKVIEHSRRMLTHNAIFFSSARHFNDPFDCTIRFEIGDITDDFWREKVISMEKKRRPSISDPELQAIVDHEMRQRTWEDPVIQESDQKYFQEEKFNQGIFGLSEPKDNLLMWSNYANGHQGFCVGFDTNKLEAYFTRLAKDDYIAIVSRKVQYKPDYPQLYFFDLDDTALYEKPLITKSSVWEYEQEHRFIRMKKADVQYSLDDGIIVEVILGCRMPPGQRDEIKDVLREKGSRVELFEARMKEKSFGLDFSRVDY